VIIGNLELQRGEIDAAHAAYRRAEHALPGDAMVNAALARIAIARGDEVEAEVLLRTAVEQRPLPEHAIALGELLAVQGRPVEADAQYALVRATQQLLAAGGVNTDAELALFDADHAADPQATFASALSAYARHPNVLAADALAWAAYRAGRLPEARLYIAEAMRLGTHDARIAYHAGVIAAASGDRGEARSHLESALEGEHALSPAYAADARETLSALSEQAAR
jgi:hypothetical protein